MSARTELLAEKVKALLGDRMTGVADALGEVTVTVKPENAVESMTLLRDDPELRFEQVIDVCGMDYKTYGDGRWEGARFAAVYHCSASVAIIGCVFGCLPLTTTCH